MLHYCVGTPALIPPLCLGMVEVVTPTPSRLRTNIPRFKPCRNPPNYCILRTRSTVLA